MEPLMLPGSFRRYFPSSPNPISPIPILPNFSPHFALWRLSLISPPTHFALYHFSPLPPRPIIFSPTYHFALLPIHPLPIRRFAQCHLAPLSFRPCTTSPNANLPIYHLALLSCHHSVSVSLKLLTTAHDFLVLEPKQLPGTG